MGGALWARLHQSTQAETVFRGDYQHKLEGSGSVLSCYRGILSPDLGDTAHDISQLLYIMYPACTDVGLDGMLFQGEHAQWGCCVPLLCHQKHPAVVLSCTILTETNLLFVSYLAPAMLLCGVRLLLCWRRIASSWHVSSLHMDAACTYELVER